MTREHFLCLVFPKAEMASQAKGLLSEECRDALNQVASYELHVSDAYLSMACY